MLDKKISAGPIGVILAGGLSSRMGRDKAKLAFSAEDLLTRSVKLLGGLLPKVLIIGRSESKLNTLPCVECIPDAWPRSGPVGGLATALRHSGADCLAISCDLPFMTAPILQNLISAWAKKRPETLLYTYAQKETGKAESLVSIYSFAALRLFEEAMEKNMLKLSLVIPPEKTETLEYSFTESLPFFNVNYPADLLLAGEYLRLKKNEMES